MIEKRMLKFRRIGEKNGKIDWWGWIYRISLLTIFMAIFYGSYEAGKYVEVKRQGVLLDKLHAELFSCKMAFYGKDYFYFQDKKGILYFVKKAKDLDDKKKWIKAK